MPRPLHREFVVLEEWLGGGDVSGEDRGAGDVGGGERVAGEGVRWGAPGGGELCRLQCDAHAADQGGALGLAGGFDEQRFTAGAAIPALAGIGSGEVDATSEEATAGGGAGAARELGDLDGEAGAGESELNLLALVGSFAVKERREDAEGADGGGHDVVQGDGVEHGFFV
jgi:hypothetical protein